MDTMHVHRSYYYAPDDTSTHIKECFGLENGYVREICDIDVPTDFSVMYVTGESGSGKSSILGCIAPGYEVESIPLEKPLSSWCGDTEEDEVRAINLMSMCGLSDATLFVSRYECLSDSEKARARLFLELKSDKELLVVDEFLSTLDRTTAKSLAYCFQKIVRRMGKKLIVATAHDDLEAYLKPDVVVRGTCYPSRFVVGVTDYDDTNPITDGIDLRYADRHDYRNLDIAELHYKGKYPGGIKECLFAYHGSRVVGCLVSVYNMTTKGRRIARLIVHPSFRSTGVGQMLVRRYTQDYPNTDVIAAMAAYNKVFEKSGMIRVRDSVTKSPSGMSKRLRESGFDTSRWYDRGYCTLFCESERNRELISEYASKCSKIVQPGGRKLATEEIADMISHDPVTAGRVLYHLRDRRLAKFVTPSVAKHMVDGKFHRTGSDHGQG